MKWRLRRQIPWYHALPLSAGGWVVDSNVALSNLVSFPPSLLPSFLPSFLPRCVLIPPRQSSLSSTPTAISLFEERQSAMMERRKMNAIRKIEREVGE